MTGVMMHNMSHKPAASGLTLVLNLDAANYSAVPANASTIAGSGAYAITVTNPNSRISWNSVNGGVFRVTAASAADFMTFGPDYSSGTQAFTVGMAYKWNGVTAGRLLNANSASPDFLMGLWDAPASRMNIAFNGSGFIGSSSTAADTAWHFIWFTWNGYNVTNSYIATSTSPSAVNGTGTTMGGFNGLRLFGRFVNSTTSGEQVDADVGFVKVWNGALTLAQIQAEWATYYTRYYGYQMSMSGTNYFNITPASVSSTATVEGWYYCNGTNFNTLGMMDWTGTSSEWTAYFDASGVLKITNSGSGVTITAATGAGYTPTINTWVHYAFTWNSTSSTSTTYTAYVNGYCVGTVIGTSANNGSGAPLNSVCRVGYSGNVPSGQWNGFLRDFRISNTLRYTGGTTGTNYFTPALRGTLVSDANTLALFSPTSSLVDSSSNNLAVTNTGVTIVAGTQILNRTL